MSYTFKFLIAIGLGLAAMVLNWMSAMGTARSVEFIAVTSDVGFGESLDGRINKLELPPEYGRLRDTAVVWADRGLLLRQRATRNFKQGDMVLLRDIPVRGPELDLKEGEEALLVTCRESGVGPTRIGDMVSFRFLPNAPTAKSAAPTAESAEWIGPFRIVSIGSSIVGDAVLGDARSDVRTLGVAVNRKKPQEQEKIQKLESYCDRERNNEAKLLRIQIHRPDRAS